MRRRFVRALVRLEAVRGGERFAARVLLAAVRPFAGVRAIVRLEVVGGGERFAAAALLASVNARIMHWLSTVFLILDAWRATHLYGRSCVCVRMCFFRSLSVVKNF